MLWRPFGLVVLVLVGLCAFAPRAVAEEPGPEAIEAARQRFKEGAAAFQNGRFKDAIDLFLDARRLAPKPAFSYNIGLAYEELDDAPNALRWYRRYLRELPDAPDRADVEERIDRAEKRLFDRGVQQVTVLSTPAGATVEVDGRPVGVTPWTGELPPGEHEVHVFARGYEDARQSFDLPAKNAIDVHVHLAEAKAVAGPAQADSEAAPEPFEPMGDEARGRPSAEVSTVTWVLLGAGAVGIGSALGLELARRGAESDAKSARTQLEGKDRLDKANSLETAARVALGLGAAAAVAGGVLLYLDLSSEGPQESASAVALRCGPASCGVTLDGAF